MGAEARVLETRSEEQELLAQCGLNSTEQTIVLYLIENRRSNTGTIARRTGIKRPTVYSALSNLETQGLVTRQNIRGVIFFSTISPRTIPIVLKNRAREQFKAIDEATRQLEIKLPLVSQQDQHTFAGYEISVLDTIDGTYALLENALTSGNYRGIFNPQTAFQGKGKELTERFLQKAAESRPHIKEIATAGPLCDWYLATINNPNHEVKVIENPLDNPMDFILMNNAAIVTDYSQKSGSAIVIKHSGYCMFMEQFFEALWANLPAGVTN